MLISNNENDHIHVIDNMELVKFSYDKITEVEPVIHNLDDYLDEMSKWESELDD